MNKRQKAILTEFIAVLVVTAIAVVAMISFKDLVNRSEAIGAMKSLGKEVHRYQEEHEQGFLPPESWVHKIKEDLPGSARLGDLQYRGLWIDFESTPDEILAYAEKNYRSLLLDEGYVVLRLDGRVEWLGKQEFEALLARQQRQGELEMLQRRLSDLKTQ